MYEIIISPLAEKKLEKLPKDLQERILFALERIRIRPEKFVRKLVRYKDLYRLRVGNYRVILEIKRNQVIILVVTLGPRKNIYKQL